MGQLRYQIYQLKWQIIDLMFPASCGGCAQKAVRWCDKCQQSCTDRDILRIKTEKLLGENKFNSLTKLAWTEYKGPARNAIIRLKYYRDKGLAGVLAGQLANMFKSTDWSIDTVVPVPLGKKRARERGYNQAELIAYPLSMCIKIPCDKKALKRVRETKAQVQLNYQQRSINVMDAFKADPKRVNNKAILLVDDVTTSGATLKACALALYDQGCLRVFAITVARTLSPEF